MTIVLLRIGLALVGAYLVLIALLWRFQERIAFPAPRGALPDPATFEMTGERIAVTMKDGTRLAGWYLPPPRGPGPGPAVLWLYGNAENIGAIAPILKAFRPPDTALLVLDYPGYGESGGRATENGIYEAAAIGYETLAARPEVNPSRIVVYGRSMGTTAATWLAARRPVAGLVLESPFTSAREMSRQHYGLYPRFVLRLQLDNIATISQVVAPVLVLHGTGDRLVPFAMGQRVARAARGPVDFVPIEGAGHNDTYEVGGAMYRDKFWDFVRRVTLRS